MINLSNLGKTIKAGLDTIGQPQQPNESIQTAAKEPGKGQGKEATKMVSGEKAKGGGLGSDIANVAGSLLHNVMTAPPIASDGMDYMGDFDLDSFIGKNLNASRNGENGLTKIIGGITKMLGLGG